MEDQDGLNRYALQAYDAHEANRDRREHLADLSGVLEIVAIGTLVYGMKQLQRELSLAQFAHALTMCVAIAWGALLEEHVFGVVKLEALLKDGFQALCTFASTTDKPIDGPTDRPIDRPTDHERLPFCCSCCSCSCSCFRLDGGLAAGWAGRLAGYLY